MVRYLSGGFGFILRLVFLLTSHLIQLGAQFDLKIVYSDFCCISSTKKSFFEITILNHMKVVGGNY